MLNDQNGEGSVEKRVVHFALESRKGLHFAPSEGILSIRAYIYLNYTAIID